MVLLRYLGTGEAFDHARPNMSFVVESQARRVLFDCGYAIPHQLWSMSTDPNYLDAIYVSHFHADHCFGLPALVARMGQDGRERSLAIAGGPGSRAAARDVLEMGYPGILEKTSFPLTFLEIAPDSPFSLFGWKFSTAQSLHSLPNYCVRIDTEGIAICYSGDGAASAASVQLYHGADLLIHEMYYPAVRDKQSHASVPEVLRLAEACNVKQLHGVHLSRHSIRPSHIVTPEAGETYKFTSK